MGSRRVASEGSTEYPLVDEGCGFGWWGCVIYTKPTEKLLKTTPPQLKRIHRRLYISHILTLRKNILYRENNLGFRRMRVISKGCPGLFVHQAAFFPARAKWIAAWHPLRPLRNPRFSYWIVTSHGGASSKFGIKIDLDYVLIDAYVAKFILAAINIDRRNRFRVRFGKKSCLRFRQNRSTSTLLSTYPRLYI